MARVLITGSSQGLGLMAGQMLRDQGHEVVLHARSSARAEQARLLLPEARSILIGDLSTLAEMRDVATQANELGRFDAVIHNVGVGYREARRIKTIDGVSQLWAINVLAPYVLTALMHKPQRLVYLSSGLHANGDASLIDLQWRDRTWNAFQAYSDSKLHDVLLALGVARRWLDVRCNAVTPGWVATRMGGPGATDDLTQGYLTQAWLAVHTDAADVTGKYFYHRQPATMHSATRNPQLQDRLLEYCHEVSGIPLV